MDEKGLYDKYEVWEDGVPADGRFFMLKPGSDPAAVEALRAYAHATSNMALANDLRQWIWEIEERAT